MGVPKIEKWEISDPDGNMFQGFVGRNITYGFTLGSLPSAQYFTHDEKRECQHRFFFDTIIHLLGLWKYQEFRDF